ncbi:MAG: C39 family peptidase [Anaerolineales bacterium]|nr:C39 family peptidase [Anaerolineales bacterium]
MQKHGFTARSLRGKVFVFVTVLLLISFTISPSLVYAQEGDTPAPDATEEPTPEAMPTEVVDSGEEPTAQPTEAPTEVPVDEAADAPTEEPAPEPTATEDSVAAPAAELTQVPPGQQQSTTGPIPPEWVSPPVEGPAVDALQASAILLDVPSYLWQHGCGPTATGMVVGYWDANGFPDLVPGDASSQTTAVDEMMASTGHYNDYSLPIDDSGTGLLPDKSEPPAGDEHTSNSLADFMFTSFSSHSNYYGWSYASHIGVSFEDYVDYVSDYVASSDLYWWASGLTWEAYKTEIDAGRPVVFLVDTDGDGSTDHFVTGIGYDDDSGTPMYASWDTWYHTVRWEEFAEMGSGQPWGIATATFFDIYSSVPAVPNDDLANAYAVTEPLPYNNAQNTFGASMETGEDMHMSCGVPGASVWYTFTPSTSGTYTIDTFGSGFDTILHVFEGTAYNDLSLVDCNDDSQGTYQSKLNAELTAGVTYAINVSGYAGVSGTLDLNVSQFSCDTNTLCVVVSDNWGDPAAEVEGYVLNALNQVAAYNAGEDGLIEFASLPAGTYTLVLADFAFYIVEHDVPATGVLYLSAADLPEVDISALGISGDPLDADYYFAYTPETTMWAGYGVDGFVKITPGTYDVTAIDWYENYILGLEDVTLTGDPGQSISIDGSALPVDSFTVTWPDWDYQWLQADFPFSSDWGWFEVFSGDTLYVVSPLDQYHLCPNPGMDDPATGDYWDYLFSCVEFNTPAGGGTNIPLNLGGALDTTLTNLRGDYAPGDEGKVDVSVTNGWGLPIIRIEQYTDSDAAMAAKDDSRPVEPNGDKKVLPMEEGETEVDRSQAVYEVLPEYAVYDALDNPISGAREYTSFGSAYLFDIPNPTNEGTWSAEVSVDLGPYQATGADTITFEVASSAYPAAPSDLVATPISESQINLSWTDNSGDETAFFIERSLNGIDGWDEMDVAAADEFTYADTELTCEMTYYYRVRAYRDSDATYSEYSNVDSATTQTCSLAYPIQITPANGDSIDQLRPVLTWGIPDWTPAQYHIRVDTADGETNMVDVWVSAASVCGVSECTWTVNTSFTEGDYEWQMRAYTAGVGASTFSPEWAFTINSAVVLLTPTNGETVDFLKPTFTWNKSSWSPAQYNLIVEPAGGGTALINAWLNGGAVCGADECSWTPASYLSDGDYQWRVQAYTSGYGAGVWSTPYALSVAATPTPIEPVDGELTDYPRPEFVWEELSWVEWYQVEITPDGGSAASRWVNASACSAGECTWAANYTMADNAYDWRVRGYTAAMATGYWSEIASMEVQSAPQLNLPNDGATIDTPKADLNWTALSWAENYLVEMYDSSLGLNSRWLAAEDVCSGEVCSYETAFTLAADDYTWRVLGYTPGMPTSPWSEVWDLTVASAPELDSPADGETVDMGRPTFSWGELSWANWYELVIEPLGGGTPILSAWLDGSALCDDMCSWPVYVTLSDGDYQWKVRGYTAAYAVGPYAEPNAMTVQRAPQLLDPTDGETVTENQPTLSWNAMSWVTHYQVQLIPQGGGTSVDRWIDAATYCSAEVCEWEVDASLLNDDYTWQVRGFNSSTNPTTSPWSTAWNLTVDVP